MKNWNWRIVWVLTLVSWIGMVHAAPKDTGEFLFCDKVSRDAAFLAEQRDAGKPLNSAIKEVYQHWTDSGFLFSDWMELYDSLALIGTIVYDNPQVDPYNVQVQIYSKCLKET